jgi:DNA-binding ferritin-like protein
MYAVNVDARVPRALRIPRGGEDNSDLAGRLREAHNVCDEHRDVATASLIENWIDETERRTWFLFEASRQEGSNAA